ncbi:TRM32-like protein [Tanacetum coccineum]
MAKRSKRHQAKQSIDQAGCMWGLISLFDFRHGRTTRRLLSDKRMVSKDGIGFAASDPTSEVDMLNISEERHVSVEDITESETPIVDVVRTSMKELLEEEMVSEQDSTKQADGDEDKYLDSECCSQVEKTTNDHEICINCQDSSQKASHYSDLEALMKEVLIIYQNCDIDEGRNNTFSIVEEKLSAAIEVFMNEKSTDEHSKDFIDTFQMLTSNKEVFLKLLQDQNSVNSNEDQKSKSKSVENEPNNPKREVPVTRKHRNFFRRRSKSHESIPLSKIVILKPNSTDDRFKVENDVHSEKITSHFSFMEMKRRFKNAMRKEHKPQIHEKTVLEGNNGWSSPNRDHFYTEKFARKIGRVSKLKESEIKPKEIEDNEEIRGSRQHISNIYIEAKKHLSEMLSNGDDETDLMIENLPKKLGKILSFPDNNTLSSGASSRKEDEHDFVTAEMRLLPGGDFHSLNDSQPSVANVDLKEKSKVPDQIGADTCMEGTPSSMMEDTSLKGVQEVNKPEYQEEMEASYVFCEQCSSPESMHDEDHGEIVEVFDEERSPRCFELDPPEENEFCSPMRSSQYKMIEEPESSSSDRSGRPSPVSVLEPLFSDNEISPASNISRPVEYRIQPLCIQFEDQEICTRNCMENEESAFEYVEAVLLASDFNWDDFENRWLSSAQILDSSLFDEVEIFSSQPSYNQRLLFDSTNEILKEVCDCYIDFFSFVRRKIQPVPKGENLINEVWERIELHSTNNYPLSLDHLIKKDLEISKTWMNLGCDSREMVSEINDSIFEDMIDDTVLSLVNDHVDSET